MGTTVFAAVDVGASGGRVMSASITGGRIVLEAVHRFSNGPVERDGHLRWDLRTIFEEIRTGLALIPDAASIGIDTWGVDYGLLDGRGQLVQDPISYRDGRTAEVIDAVHDVVSQADLYSVTGVQFLPFNTIYQLAAERNDPRWHAARQVVLLPDLLAYWLTGELRTELTNASTTGLFDIRAGTWSADLLARLGIPEDLLPPVEDPGVRRGTTTNGTTVTTVGSHDTASAVVGVPATTERFAYIASGTWSLVGLELPTPVLSHEARQANFTNELGVDGRIRFLRNVGGLWLIQECLRTWRRSDLDVLLDAAAALPARGPQIDVDDPELIAPGDMPSRVATAAGRAEMSAAETVRCILDSLAGAYARTIRQAAELSGRVVEVLHVVGGGAQNALLCQLTADATGLPVLAGPVEATALGNVVVQARAAGALPESLGDIRAQMAADLDLKRYEPR